MFPDRAEKLIARDYGRVYHCFKDKSESDAVSKWTEIKSRSDESYVNKVFNLAIKNLIVIGKYTASTRGLDMIQALRKCEHELCMVFLISKDADLSSLSENGCKAVDNILYEIIGHEVVYDEQQHKLKNVLHTQDLKDELILNLFYAVLDKNVLNSEFQWGYSYLSLFILLSWWDVVRWGLDAGADVSDNGVCRYIPLDAALKDNRRFTMPICQIIVRLIHPTNANRPTIPGPNEVGQSRVYPLHKAVRVNFPLIQHLLNAGACTDVVNDWGELPIDLLAERLPRGHTPNIFRRLIPKSVGISPTLLIKIVHKLKVYCSEAKTDMFSQVFCEHLRLSSGWDLLGACESLPTLTPYSPGFDIISCKGRYSYSSNMCTCEIMCLIDFFTKMGIRAKQIMVFTDPDLHPMGLLSVNNDHKVKAVKTAWNEYTTSVPSLYRQCVRVVRSSLQSVTDERLEALPVPKRIKEDISLKSAVDALLSSLTRCDCRHGSS